MDYKKIFKNTEFRLKLINCLAFVPKRPYLKMVYKIKTGKKLNLKNPKGFNEKLNWLKINDVHYEYSKYVDKIAVRDIIKEKIGEEYLIPLLGVWDKFEDIDFDRLPNEFVLKCNHDSGSVKIIKNKNEVDKKSLGKYFKGRLKYNPYYTGREYPYKCVKPCIIAEKFMKDEDVFELRDYKFFCFNGKPEIMFIATDRQIDTKFDFFDMNFNHLDIINIHPNADKLTQKPKNFEKMKEIVSILSKGFKTVRIDLYEINGQIYFGEYTFFHGGGFWLFKPDEWEKKLGDLINLGDKDGVN